MTANKFRKAGLFVALLALAACEDEKSKSDFKAYLGPVEEAEKIQILYSEAGKTKVKLNTDKQIKYSNEDKIFPKPITINFYDATGAVTSTLRSDSGRFDSKSSIYKVMGHVVVNQLAARRNLFTTELYWNPATKKTYTDKAATIESLLSGEIMKGVGLDANQDFSEMVMRKTSGFFNAPAGVVTN
jgi:LPS export ABC transporter protein LptC